MIPLWKCILGPKFYQLMEMVPRLQEKNIQKILYRAWLVGLSERPLSRSSAISSVGRLPPQPPSHSPEPSISGHPPCPFAIVGGLLFSMYSNFEIWNSWPPSHILKDNLSKFDFNFRYGFGRVSKPLDDVYITTKEDSRWVQIFITLPPF